MSRLTTNRCWIVVIDIQQMQSDVAQRTGRQQNARIGRERNGINSFFVATKQSVVAREKHASKLSHPFALCARLHKTHRTIVLF